MTLDTTSVKSTVNQRKRATRNFKDFKISNQETKNEINLNEQLIKVFKKAEKDLNAYEQIKSDRKPTKKIDSALITEAKKIGQLVKDSEQTGPKQNQRPIKKNQSLTR